MRIATTLEILRRGALGQAPEIIARELHLGTRIVQTKLNTYGWPNLETLTTGREKLRQDYLLSEAGQVRK